MKIEIRECKGDTIEYYKTIECDSWFVKGRHISVLKDKKQIIHLPARYFTVEQLDVPAIFE
tara:strand:- start:328 stop:510 length:183 start_codon:yes stop_codon:yes gene_type:complete